MLMQVPGFWGSGVPGYCWRFRGFGVPRFRGFGGSEARRFCDGYAVTATSAWTTLDSGAFRQGCRHKAGTCLAIALQMTGFRTHEDFDAWKLADELRRRMRPILARPDLRADRDLWKQLRRATRSPCPNIAEGFSRFNPPDFANFVRIARASLSEFIEHMKEAEACGYTTEAETAELVVLAKRARGAATGLIRYLAHAKPPQLWEKRKRRRPRSEDRET